MLAGLGTAAAMHTTGASTAARQPVPPQVGGISGVMADAREAAEAAQMANRVAKELGVTPQQAVQGAKKGAEVAQALGITPAQALKFGMAASKAMK